MTSAPTTRDVIGVRVEDNQALLANLAETIPAMQFMREIPFNGIQACERAIEAGAKSGLVVVDYVDEPFPARKLRFWDTGDGMTRTDLFERLVSLSATARSSVNFGVGAKLSLTRVSPHGVVYISQRDGATYMARMERSGDGAWGMAVLNKDGADDIDKSVVSIDPSYLPEDIRDAGHGTAVILLGSSEDDPSAWTLRPEGSNSRRWVIETLNDRFTQFPANIEVRAVMPDVEQDKANGRMKDDTRTVRGSAENLRYYTNAGKGSSDPATGARGKVRINGPIPATAYWWVLPEGAKPPSLHRIGGNVRVVLDGEAYETHGVKFLTAAGVWNQTKRVEIHFVPDDEAGARPDLQRATLKIDGHPVPLLEWCEEFKKSMPTAIKNMLAGAAKSTASADFTAQLAELNSRLVSAPVGRRSSRGKSTGIATGTVTELGTAQSKRSTSSPQSHAGHGNAKSGGLRRLFERGRNLKAQTAAVTTGQGAAGDGELVSLTSATGRGRQVRAVAAPLPMPQFGWVNETNLDDDTELGEYAGRYLAADNLLVLNGQGATYRRLLASYTHKYREVPGSKDEVRTQVRSYFELMMADALLGIQRDFPGSWEDLVDPKSLTMRASGVYHIDTRLRQVFNRKWKNEFPQVADEFDGDDELELDVA